MKRMLIIAAILVVIAFGGWIYSRPPLTPVAEIRTSFLAQTPVGSGMDDVWAFAQKHKLVGSKPIMEDYEVFRHNLPSVHVTGFPGWMPHDPFPHRSSVFIRWQFDSSNRLYDISVTRIPDSPQ